MESCPSEVGILSRVDSNRECQTTTCGDLTLIQLFLDSEFIPCIISAAVDRTVKFYALDNFELLDTTAFPSPVLSISIHPTLPRFLLASTMEGSVILVDLVTRQVVQKLKDHSKYVIRCCWSPDGKWVATCAYDKLVHIYAVVEGEAQQEEALLDGEEADELSLRPQLSLVKRHTELTRTNPEGCCFLPDSSALVYSAREDHIVHYIDIPSWKLSGYNLNPNGDAWCSFSMYV